MKKNGLIILLLISHVAIADNAFTQNYHGPTTVIQGDTKNPQEQSDSDSKGKSNTGFEQHFYGETKVYTKDCVPQNQGKQQPPASVPGTLAVNMESIPDQEILEAFVKRGLAQKIINGSLSLAGSQDFSELKSALQKSHPVCEQLSSGKGKRRKH